MHPSALQAWAPLAALQLGSEACWPWSCTCLSPPLTRPKLSGGCHLGQPEAWTAEGDHAAPLRGLEAQAQPAGGEMEAQRTPEVKPFGVVLLPVFSYPFRQVLQSSLQRDTAGPRESWGQAGLMRRTAARVQGQRSWNGAVSKPKAPAFQLLWRAWRFQALRPRKCGNLLIQSSFGKIFLFLPLSILNKKKLIFTIVSRQVSLSLNRPWRRTFIARETVFFRCDCAPHAGAQVGSPPKGSPSACGKFHVMATFKASGKTCCLQCTAETPENNVGCVGAGRRKRMKRVSKN